MAISRCPRARHARAAFGLLDHDDHDLTTALLRSAHHAAEDLHRALPVGGIALITGPSGSGKSTLLRALTRTLARQRHAMIRVRPTRARSVIDAVPGPVPRAIAFLAGAGLADATLLDRPPRRLSEGQRARLDLAAALARAARRARAAPITLLADELASTLDRLTAACLCRALARTLRRLARDHPIRLVAATAHHDVADWLEPDLVAALRLPGIRPQPIALETRP